MWQCDVEVLSGLVILCMSLSISCAIVLYAALIKSISPAVCTVISLCVSYSRGCRKYLESGRDVWS